MMNILFWNCRGVGKKGVVTCLSDMIKDHSLDFVCLQETHKKKYTKSFMRRLDGHKSFIWNSIPFVGKSESIFCGFRQNKFDIISWIKKRYILQVNLFDVDKKMSWALCVVYGAALVE